LRGISIPFESDLIFRQSGWRRISFVGKSKEFFDIDLEDPINGDLYQMQIKSEALRTFKAERGAEL
jgi:hypothetical protein